MWQYDIKNNKAELIYPLYAVKSVCNSADGVLMLYPTTEWWSDGLINEKGSFAQQQEVPIYLDNNQPIEKRVEECFGTHDFGRKSGNDPCPI